jgi:hypothetical protein
MKLASSTSIALAAILCSGVAVAQSSTQQTTVPSNDSATASPNLAGKNGKVKHDKNKAARPTPMVKGDAGPKSGTDSTLNQNTSTDLPKKGKP